MPDSLEHAVADLLRRTPDAWGDTPDDVPAEVLVAITGAGFVERRITFTVQMPGSDAAQRITIEATGEFGIAEAMRAAVQDWWAKYGQLGRRFLEETGEPMRPIVVRQRDEWRLTADGRQALADLEQGRSTPVDFALKRGFFDGRPRVMPGGGISQRLPVRGHGRLVSLENAPSGPLNVTISNWDEGAKAFAGQFAAMQSTARVGHGEAASEPSPESPTGFQGGAPGAAAADSDAPATRARGDDTAPTIDEVKARILRVLAGGATSQRLTAAAEAIVSGKTVDEKLRLLCRAINIPPHVSAASVAEMIGCDPSSVKKSEWWQTHRAGARERRADERRERLRERDQRWERGE